MVEVELTEAGKARAPRWSFKSLNIVVKGFM